MLAAVSVLVSGCALFSRPVGAPTAQLTESQRLYATWGRSIEASRSTLVLATHAVGAAYGRDLVSTQQVRVYRAAATGADRALSVAASLLVRAIEAAERRESIARGEPVGPPVLDPGEDAIVLAFRAAGDAVAAALDVARELGAWP